MSVDLRTAGNRIASRLAAAIPAVAITAALVVAAAGLLADCDRAARCEDRGGVYVRQKFRLFGECVAPHGGPADPQPEGRP